MKRSILLLFISVSLFSCGKNNGDSAENYIKLPEAINFFSNEFKSANKIAFKKSEDEVIEMNVDSNYDIVPVSHSGRTSYIEKNSITMYYEESPHYPFLIEGTGLFKQDSDDVSPLLYISFMHGGIDIDNIFISTLNINDPELVVGRRRFYEEISLNNKLFKKVYSVKREDHNAYSESFYAKKEGIVAFRDEKNELWVYDNII